MVIGVPKEIKTEEYRIGVTPDGVAALVGDDHTVLVERGAGVGSGFPDDAYLQAGADVAARRTVFGKADLIVKVKEPLPPEYDLLREGQTLFTYLHLAPNRELTEMLLRKNVTALAYETLEKNGSLPLLTPMSEIAGRMAPLMGAFYLQKDHGGTGVLPMGSVGVKPAKTLIFGAGTVGTNAARASVGLGMETIVLNRGVERLRKIDEMLACSVRTLPLTRHHVEEEIRTADVIIGAVLVPGGRTPVLVPREMLKIMKKGAVIVDVSVDQGGFAETSRPTTHDNPVYTVTGIIHYAVANMPGAYPRTATTALANATIPYVKLLAARGVDRAIIENPEIRSAANVCRGRVVHRALAASTGARHEDVHQVLVS